MAKDAPLALDADALCRVDLRARFEGRELFVRRLSALGVADLDPKDGAPPSCEGGANAPSRVALRLSQLRVSLNEGKAPYLSGHVVARLPLALGNRFARTLPLSGWAAFPATCATTAARACRGSRRVSGPALRSDPIDSPASSARPTSEPRRDSRAPLRNGVRGRPRAGAGRAHRTLRPRRATARARGRQSMLFESLMRDVE